MNDLLSNLHQTILKNNEDIVVHYPPSGEDNLAYHDLVTNHEDEGQNRIYEVPRMIKRTPVFGDAIYLQEGDVLRLECLVDGNPLPTITWFKVGPA